MKRNSDIQGYIAERSGGKVSPRYVLVRLAGRVAVQLDEIRREQELSQDALATLVGTSKAQVNRLLSGDYTGMTTKSMCKIAAALGCVVDVDIHPPRAEAKRRPERAYGRRVAHAHRREALAAST